MNIIDLSAAQLIKAAKILEQIEALKSKLAAIAPGKTGAVSPAPRAGKRNMSVEGRARIAAAQRARWSKINKTVAAKEPKPTKKRRMSAAGRAAIRAAQKARWAKAKAGK